MPVLEVGSDIFESFLRLAVYEPFSKPPEDAFVLLELVRIGFYLHLTQTSLQHFSRMALAAMEGMSLKLRLKAGIEAVRRGDEANLDFLRESGLKVLVGDIGAMTKCKRELGNERFSDFIRSLKSRDVELLLLAQEATTISACARWEEECKRWVTLANGFKKGKRVFCQDPVKMGDFELFDIPEITASDVSLSNNHLPAAMLKVVLETTSPTGNKDFLTVTVNKEAATPVSVTDVAEQKLEALTFVKGISPQMFDHSFREISISSNERPLGSDNLRTVRQPNGQHYLRERVHAIKQWAWDDMQEGETDDEYMLGETHLDIAKKAHWQTSHGTIPQQTAAWEPGHVSRACRSHALLLPPAS